MKTEEFHHKGTKITQRHTKKTTRDVHRHNGDEENPSHERFAPSSLFSFVPVLLVF
jgi:hypothetical protein